MAVKSRDLTQSKQNLLISSMIFRALTVRFSDIFEMRFHVILHALSNYKFFFGKKNQNLKNWRARENMKLPLFYRILHDFDSDGDFSGFLLHFPENPTACPLSFLRSFE